MSGWSVRTPMDAPATEPLTLNAGDSLRFVRTLPAYPAGTYTLTYTLRSSAGASYTFSAVNSGGAHAVNVAASVTAAWTPGSYALSARVSDGAGFVASVPVAAPTLAILPDPANSTPACTQSWAELTLASVETAISQLAAKIHQSVTVNGTTYAYTDMEKLLALRQRMKAEINSARDAARLAAGDFPNPRQILTRFTRAR